MNSWLDAVQASAFAQAIAQSRWMTAALSSTHLVGFTLIVGSALIGNLRLLGAFLPDRPIAEVTSTASRAVFIGLGISIGTGALLFAPRAGSAVGNSIFQMKMLLLVVASGVQALVVPRVAQRVVEPVVAARISGVIGLCLWLGVALAGCAFILLE